MTQSATTPQMQNFEKVCQIMAKYDHKPEKLITILQEVQHEYRYLPKPVLALVAMGLKLSPAEVYGVATFYAHFTLEPQGKYIFKLCDGTACHVKQSIPILEALRERLKLTDKKVTTDDMLFTVETVSCLGACGLAPVMLINEDVYGQVTPQRAVELVDELIAKENGAQ